MNANTVNARSNINPNQSIGGAERAGSPQDADPAQARIDALMSKLEQKLQGLDGPAGGTKPAEASGEQGSDKAMQSIEKLMKLIEQLIEKLVGKKDSAEDGTNNPAQKPAQSAASAEEGANA